jgi:LysM repeat protein
VLYPVQPGDTLYRLSVMYAVTVEQLQQANCMGSSTLLVAGKWIYIPPWAPVLPTATEGPSYTPSPTWTVIVPDPWTKTPTETPSETTGMT